MPHDSAPSTLGYLLPEEDFYRLQLARDHLLLLSRLAEPRSLDEIADHIPLGLWATCLGQLTELMSQSLDDARSYRGTSVG